MKALTIKQAIKYLKTKGCKKQDIYGNDGLYYKDYYINFWEDNENRAYPHLYTPITQPHLTKKNIDLALKAIDDILAIPFEVCTK